MCDCGVGGASDVPVRYGTGLRFQAISAFWVHPSTNVLGTPPTVPTGRTYEIIHSSAGNFCFSRVIHHVGVASTQKSLGCGSEHMMMSHAEPVIGLVFHPYGRHPSDGGAHQTDGLGQNQLRDL